MAPLHFSTNLRLCTNVYYEFASNVTTQSQRLRKSSFLTNSYNQFSYGLLSNETLCLLEKNAISEEKEHTVFPINIFFWKSYN